MSIWARAYNGGEILTWKNKMKDHLYVCRQLSISKWYKLSGFQYLFHFTSEWYKLSYYLHILRISAWCHHHALWDPRHKGDKTVSQCKRHAALRALTFPVSSAMFHETGHATYLPRLQNMCNVLCYGWNSNIVHFWLLEMRKDEWGNK